MSVLLSFLLFVTISLLVPAHTHAIIFLPAFILIPIAKIVAVVIGGFSIPALGICTLWSRMTNTPMKKTLSVICLMLAFFAVALILFLKIQNPERPIL